MGLESSLTFIKQYRRYFLISIILVMLIATFYSIILNWKINCNKLDKLVTIPNGATATEVTHILINESCIDYTFIFQLGLTITMNNRSIRSGRYDLKGINSIGKLITLLTSQSNDRVRVTLVEGWSIEQYADKLNKMLKIDKDKFLALLKKPSFIKSFNINAPSLEGFLFPDTYIFLKSYTEKNIISLLVDAYKYNYSKINNHSKTNLTREEVVTLASIIQGEAMYEDEMPRISSVYHNRLNRKMLLQADPTIQYVLPGPPRRLYNKDLEIDNPYNTYKYKGLPPGAINNPGFEALKAAVNPETTDYLYFVANLDGRHIFTRTNEEHNKTKRKIKRARRKLKKK